MSTRKGFSLIDGIFIAAILAILAAILFPVFAKAREKGKQAYCLANLKQIAAAQMRYAQDNDERLPVVIPNMSFFDTLSIYRVPNECFRCPCDNTTGRQAMSRGVTTTSPSYGFRSQATGLSLGSIGAPSCYALTLDLGGLNDLWSFHADTRPDKAAVTTLFDESKVNIGLKVIHYDGVNVAFADGHCKSMFVSELPKKLEADITPRAYCMPGILEATPQPKQLFSLGEEKSIGEPYGH